MFNPLSLPAQVVEDLQTLATALRRLAEEDGDLARLREAASKLPEVEDELTAGVVSLQKDVRPLAGKVDRLNSTAADLDGDMGSLDEHVVGLDGNLQTLDKNLVGLDGTAQSLDRSMAKLSDQVATLTVEVQGFRQDLAELRDKIPGL